jgi:acetyltransferase
MSTHELAPLFEPRSVVLIGATPDASKVGGRILENLLAAGFAGRLFAINPKYSSVRGVPCFASPADLPAPVDLAVVVTPPQTVPALIDACGAAGIRAAVVITAGFSEAGSEGRTRQGALLEAARRHGMRIMGPNCLGLMRPPAGLNATFARGSALPGTLALVSQSGAVCTAMIDWANAAGIGFSSVISLGGSSDVDFGEVVDYLASDEKTHHILLYVEGVRDGRRLVSSLRAGARVKPIIVMKVGRHPAGSRAAVSHTGAIVGRDDIFAAVVRRTGIVRVNTAGELIAAALALASHVRPLGERLAIITNGGGPGVMAADRATDLGIPLAELSAATLAKLHPVLPPTWSHGNPIDLIGDAGAERYRAAVDACLADPGVDGVLAILTPQAMTDADAAAQAVIGAAAGSTKPVMACWMGEASVAQARESLAKAGLGVYRLPEMAVEGFASLAHFHRNQRLLLEVPPPLGPHEMPDVDCAREIIATVLAEGRELLTATESKALLRAFRIPVVQGEDAATVDEAVAVAERVGYPVVMKILSPDITHKSDSGGVKLALPDAASVRAAWGEIMATVSAKAPQARILGASIERMVASPHGRELMAGIVCDDIFGPAVTFGAGGIAAEVLRDQAVGLPPLNALLVEDMVRGTRVARMLGRFRHLPGIDRHALDEVLLRISEIACELPEVREMDVNPLIADENGVLALDARVLVRARPQGEARYAHLVIHPYPVGLETTLRLSDGGEVLLRPIRPEDAQLELEFVEKLSPQSRRLRFQGSLRSLTPAMLARFTQVDYDREMALVALATVDGVEREVGVCRYIVLPDGHSCEYAIVLADAYQSRGLGRRMMERLIAVARLRGLAAMEGLVLASNEGMLRLCERLGFVIERDEDPLLRRVVLAL